MSNWLYYLLIAVGALAVWLTMVTLALRGWRKRGDRQADELGAFPETPDELGEAWDDTKIRLPLHVYWNDALFGQANAGVDMQFNFARLIAHAALTRKLSAGTIIGSGTVSNYDSAEGYSCIAEKRVVEIIETGSPQTDFMRFGDTVRIEMLDERGTSIFGAIHQRVKRCP